MVVCACARHGQPVDGNENLLHFTFTADHGKQFEGIDECRTAFEAVISAQTAIDIDIRAQASQGGVITSDNRLGEAVKNRRGDARPQLLIFGGTLSTLLLGVYVLCPCVSAQQIDVALFEI